MPEWLLASAAGFVTSQDDAGVLRPTKRREPPGAERGRPGSLEESGTA